MAEFTEQAIDPRTGKVETQPPRPRHQEAYLNGPYKCGERRDHLVRVHRSHWPPKQNPSLNDRPFITANCERCGAICIVYDPVPSDMTVVLYGVKGEEAGRVVEEQGAVVDEADAAPAAGQVIDEPDRGGRRRR